MTNEATFEKMQQMKLTGLVLTSSSTYRDSVSCSGVWVFNHCTLWLKCEIFIKLVKFSSYSFVFLK